MFPNPIDILPLHLDSFKNRFDPIQSSGTETTGDKPKRKSSTQLLGSESPSFRQKMRTYHDLPALRGADPR
jgi:hypothetical protein